MKYGARLSVIDEMFLRTHRGFGFPVVLQGLWRTDGMVDANELAAVHSNLALGDIARKVVYPSVPGARPRWARSPDSHPLQTTIESTEDLLGWADHQGDVELDPSKGPGWRLSAARAGGGTVVSLVCSHVITDARGLITAAGTAFAGSASGHEFANGRSDVSDALGLTGSVLYRSLRASIGLARKANRAELRKYARGEKTLALPSGTPSSVVVTIDADEWDAAASGTGGSVNSLFVAVVAGTARRIGLTDSVTVDIPFRTTASGANALGIATVTVTQNDSPRDVRLATKLAFGRPVGAPAGFPAEIVQLMSEKTAARMTSTPGRGQVLCSNIGDIPSSLDYLGPHRATGLSTRAIHPRAEGTPTRTRLSAYLSRMDGRYTLSLVGTGGSEPASAPALGTCVLDELARWDLTATRWQ